MGMEQLKGLLKNLLDNNGYPITTNNNKNIESLFSGKTVNNLFSSDYYNATGYYEYSSFKNYAYLGNASDFKVYDALSTPKNETGYFYKRETSCHIILLKMENSQQIPINMMKMERN